MIFQHTWQRVLDGTKTQTRRLVKPGERSFGIPDYNTGEVNSYMLVLGNKRTSYRVQDIRAVQPGRGQRAAGRIRITGLRREDVRTISDDDVKAEGFSSRDEFMQTWEMMHKTYDAWVIEFELVKEAQS